MVKKGGAAGLLLVIVLVLSCLASGCAKGSGQSGQSGKKESGRIDELADEYIYQNIEEKDKAA